MKRQADRDGAVEKMGRLAETEAVKVYLTLLEENGTAGAALAALNIFRDMDLLGSGLDMAEEELGVAKERASALPEGAAKGHALCALEAAGDGISDAGAHFGRARAIALKGAGESAARFRQGKENALERPFSVTAAEKELAGVMKGLEDAFAAVDRGIGRMESASGMRRTDRHYMGPGSMGGQELEAMRGVLWPMQSLGQLIRQSHDAAHGAACRVDGMRPKARRIIKKAMLEEGFFRDAGRAADAGLQERADTARTEKPSILGRLQAAELEKVAEQGRYHTKRHNCGRGGMQR